MFNTLVYLILNKTITLINLLKITIFSINIIKDNNEKNRTRTYNNSFEDCSFTIKLFSHVNKTKDFEIE